MTAWRAIARMPKGLEEGDEYLIYGMVEDELTQPSTIPVIAHCEWRYGRWNVMNTCGYGAWVEPKHAVAFASLKEPSPSQLAEIARVNEERGVSHAEEKA